MITELSILIPTYNDICFILVCNLQQQAENAGITYEIIVGDDGSTSEKVLKENRRINQLSHCCFWERGLNCGRAAIRNALANKAQYKWLLFIDSDMTICSHDFIRCYIESNTIDVVYGGYIIGKAPQPYNLRYLYEKAAEDSHTAEHRKQHPYQDFHTSNFLIRRDIMIAHLFDRRFRHYGYEDVLFGKQLEQSKVEIVHINNPVCFTHFETNEEFISKTEEALRTLHTFRHELKGYSRLIDYADRIPLSLVRIWHFLFGRFEKKILTGDHPQLWIYSLYRLGFYSSIKD